MPSDRPSFAAFLTMLVGVLLVYGTLSQFGKSGFSSKFLGGENKILAAAPNSRSKSVSAKTESVQIARQKTLARIGATPSDSHFALSPAADNVIYDNAVSFATVEPHQIAIPAPENLPAARYYQVKNGDTLFKIAKKVYGDGKQWEKIRAANGLDRGKTLIVGQRLLIP